MRAIELAFLAALLAGTLSACAEFPKERLLFASANSIGVNLTTATASNSGGLVLGYKTQDLAILPTYAQAPGADPSSVLAHGPGKEPKRSTDSLSVLAQFGGVITGPRPDNPREGAVGLQKFFSTGMAAQSLSGGFACRLALGKDKAPTNPANPVIDEYDPAKCRAPELGVTRDGTPIPAAQ